MKVLLTGSAGFIGFHVSKALIERGYQVIGLDSLNAYYDVNLKIARLKQLGIDLKKKSNKKYFNSDKFSNFKFFKIDLSNTEDVNNFFKNTDLDSVCNLAAQAGVRYSLEDPYSYINSNITGFLNILENCKIHKIKNLSFASSSSVYGLNDKYPLRTDGNTDHPISLYASTKKSNELMAHTYSHLYGIKSTGLRFFTVYGPWGRPDMALFKFVKAALNNEEIEIYNNGKMIRDFTYIDDIVKGVLKVIENPAEENIDWKKDGSKSNSSSAPFRIYNIGNSNPINLLDFIEELEKKLELKIKKRMVGMQPGDVEKTFADVSDLHTDLNYRPTIEFKEGISNFVDWYKEYYSKI